jgi:protein dithiol oxidoreductase (disulfide-forming)
MTEASTPHPTRRGFLALFMIPVAVALALPLPAAGQEMIEGKQYARIKNALPVETGKKIEVLEFFSYGCPHCRDLDPELQAWLKTLPADVEFRRVPIDFGRDQWANMAKMYLTLEALGAESKLTPEFFDALHGKGMQMWNEKTFFDWAASKGLDRKKVEETYASFGVSSKFNRARQQAKAYNVQSVPLIIVDGKFVTAPDKVGSHSGMPAAINALIAKARAERPKA